MHAALDEPLERACEIETRNMIRTRLTEDAKEAMSAFTEKRAPRLPRAVTMSLRRAAIVSPVRTPVGALRRRIAAGPVEILGADGRQGDLERTQIDPRPDRGRGVCTVLCEQRDALCRALDRPRGRLAVEVPGMQLDRRCGGGLQAVVTAAMMVQSGAADVVMAGGVESMSNIEYYTTDMRWGARAGSARLHDRLDRGPRTLAARRALRRISGMIETAENLAREYAITREAADEYAAAVRNAPRPPGPPAASTRSGARRGAAEERVKRSVGAR